MEKNESMTAHQTLAENGKSFNWARRFLGQRMGHDAAVLYRFCRVLDDMADGIIIDGPQRLHIIRNDLVAGQHTNDPLLADFLLFIQRKKLPVPVIIALIDGLLQDQKPVRIKDVVELLRYAYRVAGTVGLLMCHILDCKDDQAHAHAIDLGIAMQLTNIARDVLEDAKMGRRYLPSSWTNNLTSDQIINAGQVPDGKNAQLVGSAIKQLLKIADDYYLSGINGLAYLPFRAHIAIAVAARIYQQIGVQLAVTGFAWHCGRQVTNSTTKVICSLLAFGSVWRRFCPKSPHQKSLHDGLKGLPYVS